jgi:hypothetical protein
MLEELIWGMFMNLFDFVLRIDNGGGELLLLLFFMWKTFLENIS